MQIDIETAFKYIFKDEKWPTKILVTAVISLVPILNFAVIGYELEIMRNIWAKHKFPLPDWDNLQDKFMLGLPLALFFLILYIPLFFIVVVFILVIIASFLSIIGTSFLTVNYGHINPLSWLSLPMAGMIIFFMVINLIVYMICLSLLRPAWMIRYAKTGDWHSLLQLGELVDFIKNRLGSYFIAFAIVMVAGWALGMVSSVMSIPFSMIPMAGSIIGMVLGMFLSALLAFFRANIYGQLAMLEK